MILFICIGKGGGYSLSMKVIWFLLTEFVS